MDATNATAVYSTSTDEKPVFGELSDELKDELQLIERDGLSDFAVDERDYYDEWCFVCSRPTDHRSEHDDLVEEGKARYDENFGMVYYNPLGLLNH